MNQDQLESIGRLFLNGINKEGQYKEIGGKLLIMYNQGDVQTKNLMNEMTEIITGWKLDTFIEIAKAKGN